MKITKIASDNGILYRIEDVQDNFVALDSKESLVVLHFLLEELDELARQVNEQYPGETDPPTGREHLFEIDMLAHERRIFPWSTYPHIRIDRRR